MSTKELIEKLQLLDPIGDMEIFANVDQRDYPVSVGRPSIAYINDKDDWDYDEQGEKVISLFLD
jgi:hypothetical protein